MGREARANQTTTRDWSLVPWTPFVECSVETDHVLYSVGDQEPPARMYANSRYQVSVWLDGAPDFPVWGEWMHLSIKTHDRSARHDWRDLQRIKNEIVGPEYDALEVYPAESKLVDTANQYHLFVFRSLRFPFGFQSRLVADGSVSKYAPKAEQREFEPDARPADCITGADLDAMLDKLIAEKQGG